MVAIDERTPLRKAAAGQQGPPYVFMTNPNPNRVYRRKIKQFQCFICGIVLRTERQWWYVVHFSAVYRLAYFQYTSLRWSRHKGHSHMYCSIITHLGEQKGSGGTPYSPTPCTPFLTYSAHPSGGAGTKPTPMSCFVNTHLGEQKGSGGTLFTSTPCTASLTSSTHPSGGADTKATPIRIVPSSPT